jgi:cytochrome c oxidase cbb3-type subunit 3/ubiquinol-cytochrome c reductase cytochrome c subunit
MSAIFGLWPALCCALCLGCVGCADAPGHPAPGPEVPRPDRVLNFATLYKQNCAGCHGANGKNGAAISLSNPVYLAFAGEDTVRKITANGVGGKLMPGFARSLGGTLTDPQIDSLVHGIFQTWGNPDMLAGSPMPPYTAGEEADANRVKNGGQKMFAEFCGGCHATGAGSIVDPAYLALVGDQSLRSTIVAGRPDLGMPDWRSDISGPGAHAMTDREITDIVAWLAAQRTTYPGQPYISRQ